MTGKHSSVRSGSQLPRVVVALDFGTTFSGFAYARTSEPESVYKFYDWPCANKAGAKSYCKTQTSLFYIPSPTDPGHFEFQDWGWSGLVQFTKAAQLLPSAKGGNNVIVANSTSTTSSMVKRATRSMALILSKSSTHQASSSQPGATQADVQHVDGLSLPKELADKVGFFATKFKLYLAPEPNQALMQKLPGDITMERMVVDYLKCMSQFIISELQVRYGKHFGMEDVQWCLTVPAIWDERSKQLMKVCAEKAGMVKGAECPATQMASPYPVDIILEPEAASIYCQHKIKGLNIKQGDKLLIADVGGGTIDLVVHQKADMDVESMRVQEVVASYGEIGGGSFVDSHFFDFLSSKIGCFNEFCLENPSTAVSIYSWWQGIKMGFDGRGYSTELSLPTKLSEAWERHEKALGVERQDADFYDEVKFEDKDIMSIFDPEVEKVLNLIKKEIESVRMLMVVGGFSASPYLRKRIQSTFKSSVEEVIIPEDPGGAICHGAVQLHISRDLIQSRVSKRTYGLSIDRKARDGDPPELVFVNDDSEKMCRKCLDIFVRAGESVPMDKSITKVYKPVHYRQGELKLSLYSSTGEDAKYTTQAGVFQEGQFVMDISAGMELDKARKVEYTMVFGASCIRVMAKRLNFGDANLVEQGPSVTFRTA